MMNNKEIVVIPEDPLYPIRTLDMENLKLVITAPKVHSDYNVDNLAWSTLDKVYPSLGRFYQKIYRTLGVIYDQDDNTKSKWEKQGVLLLNMELTKVLDRGVEPMSWKPFTKSVIQYLLEQKKPLAFLFLHTEGKAVRPRQYPRHLIIAEDPKNQSFTTTPSLVKINAFIHRHYGVLMDWS